MQKGDQNSSSSSFVGWGGGVVRMVCEEKKMATSAKVKQKVTIFTNRANKKFLLN